MYIQTCTHTHTRTHVHVPVYVAWTAESAGGAGEPKAEVGCSWDRHWLLGEPPAAAQGTHGQGMHAPVPTVEANKKLM